MATITIEIPKKILERGSGRRFMVVDQKEFEKELRQRWELNDARAASRIARREWKEGKTKQVADLKELM